MRLSTRVFIGSSSSGKEIARAIQAQLFDVADAEVWDEGVFGLSMGNLESLVQSLDIFDFAVLVLTPDDLW
jgi:predicted nucleotide-binding protein